MALLDIVKKGSTDRSVTLYVFDNTTGLPKADLAYNSTGIDLWYRREGAAVTSITEATLAALTTAHSDGGFLAVANGEYRLDLPDAAFATAANYVDVGGTFTGYTVVGGRVRLVDVDLEDTVRMGLTAMPAVASGSAGAIVTSGTGTGQISVSSGRANADVTHIATAAVSATTAQLGVNVVNFGGSAGTFASGIPSTNLSTWLGTAPLALTSQRVNSNVSAMAADVITAAAIATNAIDADSIAADAGTEIAAAVWAKVIETVGSYTAQQAMSAMLAVLAGVTTNSGNTFKTPDGSTTRVAVTAAANERSASTITPSA